MGIFEHMKAQDGISALQLSALVGMDSSVIGNSIPWVLLMCTSNQKFRIARIMRILIAARIVVCNIDDTYSHTPKSMIYVKGEHTAVDSFGLLSVSSRIRSIGGVA